MNTMPISTRSGSTMDSGLPDTDTDLGHILDQKLAPLIACIESLTSRLSGFVTKEVMQEAISQETSQLRAENKQLKEKLLNLETQSRRDNLRFLGIHEVESESWNDCEAKVQDVIRKLGLDADSMKLVRAHRLGAPGRQNTQPRPIIVKFHYYKDKESVLQTYRGNKQTLPQKVKVIEDFPAEIDQQRKILRPFLIGAFNYKPANGQVVRAKLSVDRLIINNKTYTVDTVHEIPKEFHPVSTKEVNANTIAFYTKDSFLSNFHPCQFAAEGKTFSCVEQYYNLKKAEMFGDHEAADEIMRLKMPEQIKYRGRTIRKYDHKLWHQNKLDIMQDALSLKFTQNPILKGKLAATKNKTLVEAAPRDKYWGAGLSIHDSKLADPGKWPGQNHLGKLLTQLRASICG